MLTVPERWGAVDSRRVALPVVIVRAAAPQAGLPPVIYLHGGPGGGVVEEVPSFLDSPLGGDLVAQDQDWIFLDQRGTGLSTPTLDCGDAALNDAGPPDAAAVSALKGCAARHAAAGADFRGYTSSAVAADIEALRTALGLGEFDLYGFSYGTRVAFTVLRKAPAGLRAVVLDSPTPPEARWAEGGPQLLSREVRQVLDACAADATCSRRHPRLAQRFDAWLAAAPAEMQGPVAQFLMESIYEGALVRALPANLERLVSGDSTPLDVYRDGGGAGYREAQHLAVLCNEEFPFEDPAAVTRVPADDPIALQAARTLGNYFAACKGFTTTPPDPADQAPVSSPVPTLFLAAGIDAGCPAEQSEQAVQRFPAGQLVTFPHLTHGLSRNSACARTLVRQFLRNPAQPVDRQCALLIEPLQWD